MDVDINESSEIFDGYSALFAEFMDHCTGYPVTLAWAKSFLDSLPMPPNSVLSIGAGDGHFDELVFADMISRIDYSALEPNSEFASSLKKRALMWDAKNVRVFDGYFDEAAKLPEALEDKFDFILMRHCLYFMNNASMALKRATRLLDKGGHILVHHQTESAISELFREFSFQSGWIYGSGRQDVGMTIETISKDLQKIGIKHFVAQMPSWIFVNEFFENKMSGQSMKIVNAMLMFFLDVDVSVWPDERLKKAISFIKERSAYNPTLKKYELYHPEGFIVIAHPDNAHIPDCMEEVEC